MRDPAAGSLTVLGSITEELSAGEPCPYLPDLTSQMAYRVIGACPAEDYQRLLGRGWRRFGRAFFRPVCANCQQCRSLRVAVDSFAPNRSMRRTGKRNQDLHTLLGRPCVTAAHLDLYQRYHRDMHHRRGWKEKAITAEEYFFTFVDGQHDFGHELLFVLDGNLVGVALVDLLPKAVSAVYCYYDPDLRQRGLGVFSVLQQLLLAKTRGVENLYLGYWVEGNQSMRYKARYQPHEILAGRPELDETPRWAAVDSPFTV